MTTHSYWDEIDARALDKARRRISAERDPQPEHEEQVTPVKIAGLVIFILALFGSIAYAMPIIGEAMR